MKNLFLLLFALPLLAGCTLSQKKQFEKVQVGMEKDQVLGLLESPQRTQRWHGLDRWTYIFYDENTRYEKEIHFSDGKANYVGDVFVPTVSAEEKDNLNEASNQEAESLIQAQKEDFKKSYPDYEEKVQGSDTIRYVPQFEPLQ